MIRVLLATAALAFTIQPAAAQGPCWQDMQVYCPSVMKGGGRQLNCLAQYSASLTPACRARLVERGAIAPPTATVIVQSPIVSDQQDQPHYAAPRRARPKPVAKVPATPAVAAPVPIAAAATPVPAAIPATAPPTSAPTSAASDQVAVAPSTTINITINQQLEQLPETERREDWLPYMSRYPMQEDQFCRLMTRFANDLHQAQRHRNEVKQSMLVRQLREDLANLIPNGFFQNWVVHTVEVKHADDDTAGLILQPPCLALIGSNYCARDPMVGFQGTISEDSPLYREVAKLDHRDFVMVSGELISVKEPEPGHRLIEYRYFPAGTHCTRVEAAKNQDLFVVQIASLFKMVSETPTAMKR